MQSYFLAANFWLFIAGLTWVGKTPVSGSTQAGSPLYYQFFGTERLFEGGSYSVLIIAPILLSVVCCLLWLITARKCKAGSS